MYLSYVLHLSHILLSIFFPLNTLITFLYFNHIFLYINYLFLTLIPKLDPPNMSNFLYFSTQVTFFISGSYYSYLTTYITFFLNQIIFFLPKYVLTKSRFLYLGHIICILIPICLSHFFSYLSCQVTFSISKSHFLIPLNLGNFFL